MSARLLIIALDGADGGRLNRGSCDGSLPNISALRARGCGWGLSSMAGATDDSVWASFHYGADVGEHGRYFYLMPRDDGQLDYAFSSEANKATFWDTLSDKGLRVAVIDAPKCRAPRPLNGIHLADWLVHGRYFTSPRSFPPQLANDIIRLFGAAPNSRCDYEHAHALTDGEICAVRDDLLLAVDQKRDAGLHFLKQEAWDLFIIAFKEAHCVSHLLWEFTDPAHANFDAERRERLGDPVDDVMRRLDAAIGELAAAAGAESTVVVFAPTDFAPNGVIRHLMPAIVSRVNKVIGGFSGGRLSRALLRRLGRTPPPPACENVLYSDDVGALRIPRRSGESEEIYRLRIDLVASLVSELIDEADGLPVVKMLTRPAFEQQGPRAASLPHLLLHVRPNSRPSSVRSVRLGRITAPAPDHPRSGNHSAGGFAIAAGMAAQEVMGGVAKMSGFAAIADRLLGPDESQVGERP